MNNNPTQPQTFGTMSTASPQSTPQSNQPAPQPQTFGTASSAPLAPAPQKKSNIKKIILIVAGVVVGIILLVVLLFVFIFATNKTMSCTSKYGDLNVAYNDSSVVGYTATDLVSDDLEDDFLDTSQYYAERYGVSQYLDRLSSQFEYRFDGTCNR